MARGPIILLDLDTQNLIVRIKVGHVGQYKKQDIIASEAFMLFLLGVGRLLVLLLLLLLVGCIPFMWCFL